MGQNWCLKHEYGPHPDVPPTKENLDVEIAEKSPPGYWGFLADEWIKLRKARLSTLHN